MIDLDTSEASPPPEGLHRVPHIPLNAGALRRHPILLRHVSRLLATPPAWPGSGAAGGGVDAGSRRSDCTSLDGPGCSSHIVASPASQGGGPAGVLFLSGHTPPDLKFFIRPALSPGQSVLGMLADMLEEEAEKRRREKLRLAEEHHGVD